MMCLLIVLSDFHALLRPTQKALVGQIPAALPVFLFRCPPLDNPFLFHPYLLVEPRFPGEYYQIAHQCGVNVMDAATSSGAISPVVE
jgi:hypothetical protein